MSVRLTTLGTQFDSERSQKLLNINSVRLTKPKSKCSLKALSNSEEKMIAGYKPLIIISSSKSFGCVLVTMLLPFLTNIFDISA